MTVLHVRVLKSYFVVDNRACEHDWQTDKQLYFPVDCRSKKDYKGGHVYAILEHFEVYIIESRGLIAD
jgi:hypothetical protein